MEDHFKVGVFSEFLGPALLDYHPCMPLLITNNVPPPEPAGQDDQGGERVEEEAGGEPGAQHQAVRAAQQGAGDEVRRAGQQACLDQVGACTEGGGKVCFVMNQKRRGRFCLDFPCNTTATLAFQAFGDSEGGADGRGVEAAQD